MVQSLELKEYIKEKSKELGIDICKFTDGQPLEKARDYLSYRFENNRTTEFEEKNIEKRINPKMCLPSCKSIIVLGLSYNVDYKGEVDFPLKGRLSMSSWGIDYHRVLKEKIENLINKIKEVRDFDYKYFVDTGPLVERDLAYKAGVGYYGKNCSIINDDFGSFIFLGHILTDLELEVDQAVENKCGDCKLCLEACPTGSLEQAGRLNPKKCISYLTQTKDQIPPDLAKKMGIKIYGCDTCQLVCPKNIGVKKSKEEKFIPYETKGYLNLEELMIISNREFKNKYGSMAGAWRGKNVLKRNAKIILENIYSKDLEL